MNDCKFKFFILNFFQTKEFFVKNLDNKIRIKNEFEDKLFIYYK